MLLGENPDYGITGEGGGIGDLVDELKSHLFSVHFSN